ncbi:MAG: NAD(P)/FAD-dependent oxidoreductase [Candidatus Bipolaricaulota bacterium]
MERYDVLVVGAAAGAVAARSAALAGARVLLIERSPNRPPRCTGLVGPRTVDLLGLPSGLVLREIRAVRVCAPSGGTGEFRAPGPKGYVLDRSRLDRWLLERAADAGAVVRSPVAAVGVAGRVLHTTAGPVAFEVLIGADGAASAVRRWTHLPPPGEILVGVQARVEPSPQPSPARGKGRNRGTNPSSTLAGDAVEVHLGRELAPGGFAWAVPAEEGTVRVGLITSSGRAAMPLLSRFLGRRYPGARVLARESGLVPIGPPSRTVGDGTLLVGDAAAQVKPLSGGGILFGTISARIAGEVAAQGAGALPEYEARWRAEIGDEIAFGLRARKAFLALSDQDLDRVIPALDRPELRRLVSVEGDIDRPSRLVRAVLTRPDVWAAVVPAVRAVGGWARAWELALGLPAAPEPR